MVAILSLSLLLVITADITLSDELNHRRKRQTIENIPDILLDVFRQAASSGLVKETNAFDKSPMSRLTMTCKGGGYGKILGDFPLSTIRWKHNGENLVLQPSRMFTTLDTLTIENLIPSDSGVYHCQLGLTDTFHLIVKIYTIVVGHLTKRKYLDENLSIDCNARQLGKIFENATRFWQNPVGTKTFRKPAREASEDVISSSDNKTNGTWTCFVENSLTNQTWKTARIKITLEPPLSDWDKIKLYAKDNKPIVAAALFVASFIVVLLIDAFTKVLEWKEKKFKKELEEVQTILGLDPAGAGPEGIPLLLDEQDDSENVSTDNSESDSESIV